METLLLTLASIIFSVAFGYLVKLAKDILEKETCESKLRNIKEITAKDIFDFA